MTSPLDLHRITRSNILRSIEGLSLEQLNFIPQGFTGNIAWHIGHVVATQQGLLYRLSSQHVNLEGSFIEKYKKGSVPVEPLTGAELEFIKTELGQQPERLKHDIENDLFQDYTPYTTSYGNTIHSFQEALVFVNVHEGLHLGYIMALKRAVLSA